jgi:head-tail adaptor
MSTGIGAYRNLVVVQNPVASIPDGDGGFTQTWVDLSPRTWQCSINPATARDLERVAAGAVLSTASHIVEGRYHPGITTATRIIFGARTLTVTGVSNPEERNITTIATATETVA